MLPHSSLQVTGDLIGGLNTLDCDLRSRSDRMALLVPPSLDRVLDHVEVVPITWCSVIGLLGLHATVHNVSLLF